MRRIACMLLLIVLTCSLSFLHGHPADPVGAARSDHHLPFSPSMVDVKESHIARDGDRSALMRSDRFDTTHVGHSALDALTRESDTKEFARWLDHTLEHEGARGPLLSQLRAHPMWTIFAPTNAAVTAFLEKTTSEKRRVAALRRHLIPDQSFVMFEQLTTRVIPMRTLQQHTQILVCDLATQEDCLSAAPNPVNASHLSSVVLRHRDVVFRNRMTGNGVVHVVDRVFRREELVAIADRNPSADSAHDSASASASDLWSSDPRHNTNNDRDGKHRPCTHCSPVKPTRVKATPPPTKIHADGRHQLQAINMTHEEREKQSRDEEHERSQHREEDGHDHRSHALQDDVPIVHLPASGPSGGNGAALSTDAAQRNIEVLPGQPHSEAPPEPRGTTPSRDDIDESAPDVEDDDDDDSPDPAKESRLATPQRYTTPLRGNGHPLPKPFRTPPTPTPTPAPGNETTPIEEKATSAVAASVVHLAVIESLDPAPSSSAWYPTSTRTWIYFALALATLFLLTLYSVVQRVWPDRCTRLHHRVCCCLFGSTSDEVDFDAVADAIDQSPLLANKPRIKDDRAYQASQSPPPDL